MSEKRVETCSYPIRLMVGISRSGDATFVRGGLMFVYERYDGSAGYARVWDYQISQLIKFSDTEVSQVVVETVFIPGKEGFFGHPSSEENVVKEVIINRHA